MPAVNCLATSAVADIDTGNRLESLPESIYIRTRMVPFCAAPFNAPTQAGGRECRVPAVRRQRWSRPIFSVVCTAVRLPLVCVLLIAAATMSQGLLLADEAEPEIEVAVSSEDIFFGESIDFQVEVRNMENPPAPDVSSLKEFFDVVPTGNQSRNQSSTFIINGRVSQQNVLSHVYLYRLTPKSSGDLTIPPVRVVVNGNEIQGRALRLRVQDAEDQDVVLAEVSSDRMTVYPTQPFVVTLRILVKPIPGSKEDPLRPLRRQPPHLQISWLDVPEGLETDGTSEWLQPLLSEDGSGFTLNEVSASTGSIFGGSRAAVFGLQKSRETRNGLDGTPIEYFVYQLSRTFTAGRAGSYTFGPALVKGTFVGSVEGNEYVGRRIVAIASAAAVEVREVPSPRPATFIGGIGDYHVAASANPVRLRVGDPLTLTLQFARSQQSGSLELISAPDLSAIPEIADRFDIIDKSPTGRVEGELKKFSYAMRPRKPDVSVPSITLTTFDPSAERFTEIRTEPIDLDVSEATRLSPGELVGTAPALAGNEIKKSNAGIFQNITDPSELNDERVNLIGWLTAIGSVWMLSAAAIGGIMMHRRRSMDVAGLRRSQARKTAAAKLAHAGQLQRQGDAKEAHRQIRAAFVGLVADLKNVAAEGLTASDVDRTMKENSVQESDRLAVVELLQSIESAEYGGGAQVDTAASLSKASALMERIGPVMERSGRR